MRKILGIVFMMIGVFILIGAIGSLNIGNWFGSQNEKTKSISLDRIEQIEIDSASANINIIPEDREDLQVNLNSENIDRIDFSVDRRGDKVRIDLDMKWFHWFGFSHKTTLDIYIPEEYNENVSIDLKSGRLDFNGQSKSDPFTLNELDLDMSSGNVELSNIHANRFLFDGSSGKVDTDWVTTNKGTFELTSGDIQIDHYFGELDVNITSGRFTAQLEELNGPIKIDATSGNVTLHLPESPNFTLEGRVKSGNIRSKFKLQDAIVEDRIVRGSYGTGKHMIDLYATSGNITID